MIQQKLIVIASYPPKGTIHEKHVVGGASYTKITLTAVQDIINKKHHVSQRITVLAEKLPGQAEVYEEDNMIIKRLWKRNSLKTFILLAKEILKDPNSDHVLLEFELAMFGEKRHIVFLPLFLFVLKLFHKNITIVFHQVIDDLDDLSGHINIEKHSLKSKLFTFALKSLYISLHTVSDTAIVFDEALKERLTHLYDRRKIMVIPLGIEKFNDIPTKQEARKKLNIKNDAYVIVLFGFLAWYKGTDWIISHFAELKKSIPNLTLLIAGGPNPNHTTKKFYQEYVDQIVTHCKEKEKEKDISISGFVAEKDIPVYFQAADCIIFPYRTYMSTSGPLTLTYSFKKPFLVGKSLEKVFSNPDIHEIFQNTGLDAKELIFDLTTESLIKRLGTLKSNYSLQKKIDSALTTLSDKRAWHIIAQKYYEILFAI